MHTVVSVKNPIGSAIMPSPFERGLRPRNPALGGGSEERASGARRASEGGQSPPPSSIPSAQPSALLHVADEGLPLVNRDVGIRDEGRQFVGGVTRDQSLVAPVERHAHVVDGAAVDGEGPQ